MEWEGAGAGEDVEFVAQRLADPLDTGELVGGGKLDDVAVKTAHGVGPLAVGSHFERVFVFEVKQQGDFLKNVGKNFSSHIPGILRPPVSFFISAAAWFFPLARAS